MQSGRKQAALSSQLVNKKKIEVIQLQLDCLPLFQLRGGRRSFQLRSRSKEMGFDVEETAVSQSLNSC